MALLWLRGRLAGLGGRILLLGRAVVTNGTARGCAEHAMMASDVAGCRANRAAGNAAGSLRRVRQ